VKEFGVYTLARIGLFLASYAVVAGVWVLVSDSFSLLWPLLLAALVSGVSSYYLLRGQRERFASHVEARARAASERLEAARSREDLD